MRRVPHAAAVTAFMCGVLVASTAACSGGSPRPPPLPAVVAPAAGQLRSPEELAAAFPDPAARSRAFFAEATLVLLHPRCANCHPDGDSPLQGMEQRLHDPPVVRGPEDRGVVGVECASCHQDRNLELARVPGAPVWHLAPRGMAWVGKSPKAICEQLKDRARNGGRTLAQMVEHNTHDPLVGWGWAPGADREPAPGNQELFGRLMQAWVDTGAECPPEETKP